MTIFKGHRYPKFMILILIIFITFQLWFMNRFRSKICNHSTDDFLRQDDKLFEADTKPLMVIGILTADDKRLNRDAQRETWISQSLHDEIPFRVVYKFLIDAPTKATELENKIYNDILYLNVTTHGWAKKYGQKMYIWFKYIHENFPNALLGARVDDDVFVCVPQIFDRLAVLQSHTLHYGWGHPAYTKDKKFGHIDEMFVVLGDDLIRRISNRKICASVNSSGCDLVDADFGDLSIQEWIKTYNDVDRQADNKNIIHFGRESIKKYASYVSEAFCDNWLLYHKASPDVIRTLHGFQMTRKPAGRNGYVTGEMFSGKITRDIPTIQKKVKVDDVKMDDMVMCKYWAVVTTIFEPSEAVIYVNNNTTWCLVIVGDLRTPAKDTYMKSLSGQQVKFLSVTEQDKLYPELSRIIPLNHFGRKNIGYIYAIHHGATYIWDFDDDNVGMIDLNDFTKNTIFKTACNGYSETKLNPYPYFGVKDVYTWPRGLPLQHIKNKNVVPTPCTLNENLDISVIQSLANIQPDVDAIYRLTHDMPFNFTAKNEKAPFVIPKGVYTPFNAQATMWNQSAFAFLALPVSIFGRVADIWRSYIAQFFMHKKGFRLLFSRPYVYHNRNDHTIIKDLNAETDLYEKSNQLIDFLSSSEANQITTLKDMYNELYRRNYIETKDLNFIQAWVNTYNKITGI